MISKEKKNTLHIASCSFGKDSLATILLALEHGEPLDEAVYCEVMFDTVQYVGIASDEPVRLRRLQGDQVSLLEKYHYTEEDAKQLCQTAGLLSPVYAFTDRGGCWFCPNAKRKELRHLYDNHPELWAKMLELQAMPGKVSEKFNRTERFSDIDAAFRKEDALCQKAA